uniref:Dr1-associated corepressor n=1 Tax=Molossus molossus TaxID=27622 RepID=A0A7J8EPM7_MOLMO|nr:DR1 associated protein 1 [Molossus molossus]
MPSKKKKYNARFPPARIKKIMQTDEEIGKVAAAVPVIISRALELFLESLLKKACQVTQSRNAKTMTWWHLCLTCRGMGKTTTWMGTRVPAGAGSQAAAAGRMVGWGAKARTRSCQGQTQSRRMNLRTLTPTGKRRHRRPHPRPATPLPTFRAPQHLSCPSPRLCLCPQHPQAPQDLMQRTKRIMTPSALCPPGHTPF